MADYDIKISSLNGKKTNLDSMSNKAAEIKSSYEGSSIKSAKQGYDAVASKITTNMERLKNGYANSVDWFSSYLSELEALEAGLAGFNAGSLTKPKEFNGAFEDIFGKITMPCLKTGAESTRITFDPGDVVSYELVHDYWVSKNGIKYEYYIYVPTYANGYTGKNPVMVYEHGGSSWDTGRGNFGTGIFEAINSGARPKGIVGGLYIKNFGDGRTSADIDEFVDYMVEKYNGDTNRLSIAGQSYGAITAYKVINEHPGKYAACVPISGWGSVNSGTAETAFWAFHGTRDNRGGGSHTTYPGAVSAISQLQQLGGNAKLQDLEGKFHSRCQIYTFERPYTSPDGEEEYAWEWAMKQTKDKTTNNRKLGLKNT
jgi:pimeloyl-ACP methyl ester carboxylesterase